MEKQKSSPPAKTFTCNRIQAAIWVESVENEEGAFESQSIRISKSFKDKQSGEWKRTDRLFADDLPNVAVVAMEAYKHLRLSSRELDIADENQGE
jgi:hypothetical protein